MSHAVHAHTPAISAVDARGLTLREIALRRTRSEDEATPLTTTTTYNAAGQLIAQQDPRVSAPNLTTIYSLASQPLLTDSVDAGWRLALLGEAGQLAESWDGRGGLRQTEYDELLRPVAITEGFTDLIASPVGARFGCDEVALATNTVIIERFTYGGPQATEHNQCNQLIRHDDPAGTLHFPDYGLLGSALSEVRQFLLDANTPDWPLLEAERDALLETDGLGTQWAFSALGEVIEQTDAMGNTQRFAQTVVGQQKSVSLALAGSQQAETLVSDIHYNAFGQVEQETAGNGVISRLLYRPQDGRLSELHAALANAEEPLQHLTYDYDPVGNILSIEDAAQPVHFFANQRIEPINHYRYDTLYQLIEATGREVKTGASHGPALPDLQNLPPDPHQIANYTQSYNYDAGGNLMQMRHVGAQTFTRTMLVAPDSNRSLPEGEVEVDFEAGFDANGNLQQLIRGQDLRWDLRNQLREVTAVKRDDGPDDFERYIYDGGGQRCRKIRSAQSGSRTLIDEVRYLPGLEIRSSDEGEILHVISANTGRNNVRVLHWQTNTPPQIANDQVRYSLNDHLGSSTLELDHQGGLISQESYYPFGGTAWWAARNNVEAKYKTIRYSGKERDASGLYYYGFRYYAPWLQRWINPDPAGDVEGLNLFIMTQNNQINRIDPDGQNSEHIKAIWRFAFEEIKDRMHPSPISIKTFAPGIIGVHIQGSNEVFSKIGMDLPRQFKGQRHLTYLSIDSTYKSKIAGGDYPIQLKVSKGSDIYAAADISDSHNMAFINGGFYNKSGKADPSKSAHAAIGKIFMEGQEKESTFLPAGYEQYYVPLTMSDASTLHSAPLLTSGGRQKFTNRQLQHKKFQYSDDTSSPGQLGHANTPNQRAGISFPVTFDTSSRTRIAVGLGGSRTAASKAYTLPEWARVMLRLDKMNTVPGWSVNLDGGDSATLGVVSRSGKILMDQAAAGNPKRGVGNFIVFYK